MTESSEALFKRVFDPQFRGDLVALDGEFGSPIATKARLAMSQGQPEPLDIYADDRAVVRRLRRNPEHDAKLRALDTALKAVIALGLKNQHEFSVGIKREDAGPIAIVNQAPGRIEVTMSSNYDLVEPKDSLFAAQLSLLEWTGIRTDFLGKYLFRKVWHKDSDPVAVATAIALPLVYVFNSLRDGGAVIFHTVEDSAALAQAEETFAIVKTAEYTYIHSFMTDYFDQLDAVEASNTTPQHETKLALLNISEAYQIAGDNDDEVGLQALSQMLDDLNVRASYVDTAMRDVRAFVDSEPVHIPNDRLDRLYEEALDETISMCLIKRESFLVLDRGTLREGHPDDKLSKITKDSACLMAGVLVQFDDTTEHYHVYYREGVFELDENFNDVIAVSGTGAHLVHLTFDRDQFHVQVGLELIRLLKRRNITAVDGQPLKRYNTDLHFYPLPPLTSSTMDLVWRDRIQRLTDELDALPELIEVRSRPEAPESSEGADAVFVPQSAPLTDWRVGIVPATKTSLVLSESAFGGEHELEDVTSATDDTLIATLLGWYMRQMPYQLKGMMPVVWRELDDRCEPPEKREQAWHELVSARRSAQGITPVGDNFLTPAGITRDTLDQIDQRLNELRAFMNEMDHEEFGSVEEYNDELALEVARAHDQVILDVAAYRFRNGLRGPKTNDPFPQSIADEIARRAQLN